MIDTSLEYFLKNVLLYLDMAAEGEEIHIDMEDGRTVKLSQESVSPNRAAFK